MHYLVATLHTAGIRFGDRAQEKVRQLRQSAERGASAVEWAMIVAAVIVLVGLVIVAVRTFVENEVAKIS